MIATGGHPYQGYSVGILKFDEKRYPMIPGDVGNATSYPFPVLIREVKGLVDNPYPPLTKADGSYTTEVQLMIEAAQQFERDGVRCIAGCCGFFSLVQPVIAAHVSIPVMMSPLMMIPVIHQMLPPDRSVLVVTASEKLLGNAFFQAVGADLDDRVVVCGLDTSETFNAMCMGGTGISYDTDDLCTDILAGIATSRATHPEVGAVLLECTTLPPFAPDVARATGLPVFDFIACVEWMHHAVVPQSYTGYI